MIIELGAPLGTGLQGKHLSMLTKASKLTHSREAFHQQVLGLQARDRGSLHWPLQFDPRKQVSSDDDQHRGQDAKHD